MNTTNGVATRFRSGRPMNRQLTKSCIEAIRNVLTAATTRLFRLLVIFAGPLIASAHFASASETLTAEPNTASYNFVTHYRVTIDAPPNVVWSVLIDLKSWMYDFELSTTSGNPGEPGQVLTLYEDQGFEIQVTAVETNKLLAVANLPLTFRNEFGTGVGVFTLHDHSGLTEVSLTGSRRYTPTQEGVNPLRKRRSSDEFQNQTRELWGRFLERLRQLAEVAAQ